MSYVTGIQGQLIEINVVGCKNLSDKEWFTRQDPYVCIEYASNRFRTKTDTDGGRNPSFNEKFMVPLIEGLREMNVQVWNSNTLTYDDHIGTGRVLLEKALSTGYDDSAWPLKSRSGKSSGELRLIIHYANAKENNPSYGAGQAAPYNGSYPAQQYTALPVSGYTVLAPQYQGTYPPTTPAGYLPPQVPPPYAVHGYPPPQVPPPYPVHPPAGYPSPQVPPPYSVHPPAGYLPSGSSSHSVYPPPQPVPGGYPPAAAPAAAVPYAYPPPAYPPVPVGYASHAPHPTHYPAAPMYAGPVALGAAAMGAYELYKHGKHGKYGKHKHGKFKGKHLWGKHKFKGFKLKHKWK